MKLKNWLAIGVLVLGVSSLALGIACSSDDDDSSGTTTITTTTGASGGADIPTMAVTAREYSYDAPASAQAGLLRVTMNNAGKEDHQAQMIKLNDGVTDAQFQQALQDPSGAGLFAIASFYGGPNAIAPGATTETVQTVSAGKYAFLCFVSGDDDVPHLAKGQVKPFDVTAGNTSAKAPTASTQMQAVDYGFVGGDTLPAGKTTVQVTNNGKEPHEATIIKLEGNMTVADLAALFAAPENTPPPPGFVPPVSSGGFGAINPGATGYFVADLKAGNYAFLCFVPDATGTPHVLKGMIKSLKVQ